jgi:hypothetical protein
MARRALAILAVAAMVATSGCATGFIDAPPTDVTGESATLRGSVVSNLNADGRYWFEYGETKDYGQSTPPKPVAFTSNVKQPVSETITGLTGWTDYHYRVCADDDDPQAPEAHCSADATVTTGDPQIVLGADRPRYTLHFSSTDGSSADPQSGVASVTVDVDGKQVYSQAPGCATDSCAISDDWTLNASDYDAGPHVVTVTATDGVGRSTSRELDIAIERDTAKPSLRVSGPLASAPGGWVDQKRYGVTADAADSGYGVTSLKLLVDDQPVGSAVTQQCPDGGCGLSHGFTVDTANYSGGAHEVKLVASDGSGNSNTKSWTMNVNPTGNISAAEAAATADAAGATDADYPGTSANVQLEQDGSTLESTGGPAPTTMTTDPSDGVTAVLPSPEAVSGSGATDSGSQTIEVTPEQTASAATDASLTPDGEAAVSANTGSEVDTLIRPLYDGAMAFQMIRDAASPDTYSWHVAMEPGDTLKQVDPTTAVVSYPDGTPAFTIVAEPAHDATGAAVPTSLAVDAPDGFTLTVKHRAASYVYPVLAGPGWEHAYINPNPLSAPPNDDWDAGEDAFGAPVPDTADAAYRSAGCGNGAHPGNCPQIRRFNFVYCGLLADLDGPAGHDKAPTTYCSSKDTTFPPPGWRFNLHGHFHYLYGQWVKVYPGEYHCDKSGPQSDNLLIGVCPIANFKAGSAAYYQDGGRKLWMFGSFVTRQAPANVTCMKLVGFLPSRPPDSGPFPGYLQGDWSLHSWWLGDPKFIFEPLPNPAAWCGFTTTLGADG